MKAVWYEQNGPANEVFHLGQLDCPPVGAGEVRVKMAFSGVNPSDCKSRKGRPLAGPKVIPHSDGAGIIDAVGEGVDAGRIGQRVWLWNGQWQRPYGTAAEYIVVPSALAVKLPETTTLAAGACFGVPLLTAIQALSYVPDIQDKPVLVTGAANAVGDYVTQIAARDLGANVIATVGSAAKAAHAISGGAMATIDYKIENVAERVLALTDGAGVAAVIDMDFSTTAPLGATGCIANHATIVSYGSNNADAVSIPYREYMFRCLSLRQFAIYAIRPEEREHVLAEATRLLEADVLRHSIASVYPLADVAQAHHAVETGNGGKIGNVLLALD